MFTSPSRRRLAAPARRRLLAVITAALVIFQQTVLLTAGASAQVRRAPSAAAVPGPSVPSTTIVISQFQVAGGTAADEFVELHNVGSSNFDLNGHRLVYRSAAGTSDVAVTNWTTTTIIPPGGYYLVVHATGYDGAVAGDITFSGGSTGTFAAAGGGLAIRNGAANTGTIIDSVGYGTATNAFVETSPEPAPAANASASRLNNGCTDTDNNANDFVTTNPSAPRNSATTAFVCGGSTPALAVNDVSQDEGNSGQTAFTFTISLSSATHGGVTFNIATADGTAQDGNPAGEDTDYQANSANAVTIPNGSQSTQFTVQVNGDTTTEPNETFFVNITNVTGATVTDGQGQGTIVNDDVTLTPINQIQGSGSTSPIVGQAVTTTGIVTGIKQGGSGGFFIQDPSGDGNAETSEGIFVFTGATLPAGAVVGNSVRVSGTVVEFTFTSDPTSPPITELSSVTSTAVLSTGNALPTAVTLTAAETTAPSETSNPLDTLEEYEGMRVNVPSMTVVAPTQGNITESSATATSTGVFYGVVTGVARPFREAGIPISNPLPAGAPANVPRFDENPERIRVDSDAQPGTTAVNVSAGTTVSNVTGPLDYQFRTYTILPEATLAGTNGGATPVPQATTNEFTVASFNMQRFFDTTNDPAIGEPVLTTAAFENRLSKASLAIRTVQRYPDVIGVQEAENLSTLQTFAARVNSDAQTLDGLPDPQYTAYLVEGNDPGGIDVGYLVKASRVTVVEVVQEGKTTTYTNPNTGAQETLNDRPPLVLRATINRPAGGTLAFTVINNHLRSLNDIDNETPSGSGTEGGRVRAKRRAQAEFLANLIQTRQTSNPAERIITVGDMNAFRVNDGYVDVIGTILGTPAPADQVVLASPDLVNPDQTALVDTLPADQRYSYTFDGNAQTLDYVIVNPAALSILNRFAYARDDADQPLVDYANAAIPDRISDHDQPVAYFSLVDQQAAGQFVISEFRFRGPGPDAAPEGPTDGEGDQIGGPAPPVENGGPGAPGTQQDNDEYIEFYNNTDSNLVVATTDGSAGWALVGSDGQVRFIIPNGTSIPARRHFLVVNTDGYSLCTDPLFNCYAQGDAVLLPDGVTTAPGYTLEIPDGSGIALFGTSNPANFTTANRLDAVGYSTAPELYREGAGLPTGGAEIGNDLEYAWLRHLCAFVSGVGCTTPGTPKDTGANQTDFISVDTSGATQSLGAPGPQSLTSPYQRNSAFGITMLDPNRSSSQPPNRDRDMTADPSNNASFGTLTIRRTVTNNTSGVIDYLSFRIVQITTFPAGSNFADLRALNSGDVTVTLSNGQQVPVSGTYIETPPFQFQGGGLNTSMGVNSVNIDGLALQPGSSVNVQFRLGVQKTGTFRFYINVEAFDESAVSPESPRPLRPAGTRTRGGNR